MTSENNSNTASEKPWGKFRNHAEYNDYFAWAKAPGINPMKVAAVVAGFAVFPPLGAAALIYFLWKNRSHRWQAWDQGSPAFAGAPGMSGEWGHRGCGHRHGRGRGRGTGNSAFDQHQAEVIDKLRADREAFWSFRAEERRKRDQDAYDAFRAKQSSGDGTPGKTSDQP